LTRFSYDFTLSKVHDNIIHHRPRSWSYCRMFLDIVIAGVKGGRANHCDFSTGGGSNDDNDGT